MLNNKKIGFIGAGTMAKAIIKGIINSNLIDKNNISATEISDEFAQKAAEDLEIKVTTDNKALVQASDIIILSTKPYAIVSVLEEVKDVLTPKKLVASIAAGVKCETMEQAISKEVPVIRVMPNTPALVNQGMSAACKGKYATNENIADILELFNAVGQALEVEEKLINAVTGISGSGPAFVYLMIEALADGGLKLGLKKDVAIKLAAQTLLGGAKMVLETGKHPAILKDEVTTPGGTTIAGLCTMEEENVRSALIKTVQKTAETAEKLG